LNSFSELDPLRRGTYAADLAEEEVARAVHEELAYLVGARLGEPALADGSMRSGARPPRKLAP
jgi:hypothetical protein